MKHKVLFPEQPRLQPVQRIGHDSIVVIRVANDTAQNEHRILRIDLGQAVIPRFIEEHEKTHFVRLTHNTSGVSSESNSCVPTAIYEKCVAGDEV